MFDFIENGTYGNIAVLPPKGTSFIGFKKCYVQERYRSNRPETFCVVVLFVPAFANRYQSPYSRSDDGNGNIVAHKCRVSEAKVLGFVPIGNNTTPRKAYSNFQRGFPFKPFVYKIGETVVPTYYSHNKEVCASGIHLFLDIQQAINYQF